MGFNSAFKGGKIYLRQNVFANYIAFLIRKIKRNAFQQK